MKLLKSISIISLVVFVLSCSKEKEEDSPIPQNQPTTNTPSGNLQEDLDNGWGISILLNTTPVDSFYGMSYQGGLIFYIDTVNSYGLISGTFDINTLPSGINWYNGTLMVTGATHTAIGTGRWNTDTIVQKQGQSTFIQQYAAEKCDTLNSNGYSDWYLPSKDELIAMRTNLHLNGHGNFYPTVPYWSSTEIDINFGFALLMNDGTQYNFAKQNISNVRPIRKFDY